MTTSSITRITQGDIDSYERDGVVCLRNVFDQKWVNVLLEAWNEIEARIQSGRFEFGFPNSVLDGDLRLKKEIEFMSDAANVPDGVQPGFMSQKWSYYWNKEIRNFVHNSPAGEIVGRVMAVDSIRFFWDQMFVKKSNTGVPTYWHTDQPAWPTAGEQLPSLWIPLTPVDKELSSLEYIEGSHATYNTRDWPRTFNANMLEKPKDRKSFTDYEQHRNETGIRFASYDMQPGDAVLFSPKLYHGAGSNNHPTQDRIAISLRWFGPDITWDPRPECVNIPGMPLDKMVAGSRPNDDSLFPLIWSR